MFFIKASKVQKLRMNLNIGTRANYHLKPSIEKCTIAEMFRWIRESRPSPREERA